MTVYIFAIGFYWPEIRKRSSQHVCKESLYVLNIWDRKLKNVYDWHMGLLCRVHSLDEIEYI